MTENSEAQSVPQEAATGPKEGGGRGRFDVRGMYQDRREESEHRKESGRLQAAANETVYRLGAPPGLAEEIKRLDGESQTNPNDQDKKAELARALYPGDKKRARKLAEEVVAAEPDNTKIRPLAAIIDVGFAIDETGDPDQQARSLAHAQEFFSQTPDHPDSRLFLLVDQSAISGRIQQLSKQIEKGTNPADAHQQLAMLRLALKFQRAQGLPAENKVQAPRPEPPQPQGGEPQTAPTGEPPATTTGEPPSPAGEPQTATTSDGTAVDADVSQAADQLRQHSRWRDKLGLTSLGRMFGGRQGRSKEPPGPPTAEVKEQLVDSKIAYQASSTQGGRDYNEDAYLTAAGSYLPDQTLTAEGDRQLSGTLESPIADALRRQQAEHLASLLTNLPPELDANVTADEIFAIQNDLTRFINSGKIQGFAIVADGMGGHDAGERASSLASFLVTRYMMKNYDRVSDKELLLKQAFVNADKVSQAINEKQVPPTNMSTTLLATLTTADGSTVGAAIGDSRIYKRDKKSLAVDLLTSDTSLLWQELITNNLKPSEFFADKRRSLVFDSISEGKLNPNAITTFRTTLANNEQLILCTDGVWEGLANGMVNQTEILQRVDAEFQQDLADGMSGDQATRKAFATIFKDINLNYSHSDWALAEFLTSPVVGNVSGDNTTAVVYGPAQKPGGLDGLFGLRSQPAGADSGPQPTQSPWPALGAAPQPLMPPPVEQARLWPGLRQPAEPDTEAGEALDVSQRRDIALALLGTDTLTDEQEAVVAEGGKFEDLLKIELKLAGHTGVITPDMLTHDLALRAMGNQISLDPREAYRLLHNDNWNDIAAALKLLPEQTPTRENSPGEDVQVPELPERGEVDDEVAEQFIADMNYAEYLTEGDGVKALSLRNAGSEQRIYDNYDPTARSAVDILDVEPAETLSGVIEKLEYQILGDAEIGKSGILSIIDESHSGKYVLQLGGRFGEQDGSPIPTELLFSFNHVEMKEQFLTWLHTDPEHALESVLRRLVAQRGVDPDDPLAFDKLPERFKDIKIVESEKYPSGERKRFEKDPDGYYIQAFGGPYR